MIRAVTRVMMYVRTSVAVSIPSPITAKLPEMKPMMIFKTASIAFPPIPIHEARCNSFDLTCNKFKLYPPDFNFPNQTKLIIKLFGVVLIETCIIVVTGEFNQVFLNLVKNSINKKPIIKTLALS